jgi:hypothetical protein
MPALLGKRFRASGLQEQVRAVLGSIARAAIQELL